MDLDHELRLAELLVAGVAAGAIASAHDVADGGLAVALAECCFTGPVHVGARVELLDSLRHDALVFGESTGRVIATTEDAKALLALAERHGIKACRIGTTGADRLVIGPPGARPWIDEPVDVLHALWSSAIPRRLREG